MAIKTETVDKVVVGHNSAEIYFRFGDILIILPPPAAKTLRSELAKLNLIDGTVSKHQAKAAEPIARQVLKSLFKGKKMTKSLIAVNTKRRKKLPDN